MTNRKLLLSAVLAGMMTIANAGTIKKDSYPIPTWKLEQLIKVENELKQCEKAQANGEKYHLTSETTQYLVAKRMQIIKEEGLKIPTYLDVAFFQSAIDIESKRNPRAGSHKNALGLMQLRFAAWIESSDKPFSYAYDPIENINAGIRYYLNLDNNLSEKFPRWSNLQEQQKRDILNACYNRGQRNFGKKDKWKIQNAPTETRNHVKKTRERYEHYKI